EWLACLILLMLGWVFVPFYLRSNVFSMPEFLERRFNRQSAVYLAGMSIIAYIFTKISVQLYAASVVLERVAGWKLWETAVVLVIATGIYTVAGGLAAVIYTDTRSEEHTSELQSPCNLVCRLLLEKKKFNIDEPELTRSAPSHASSSYHDTTVFPVFHSPPSVLFADCALVRYLEYNRISQFFPRLL